MKRVLIVNADDFGLTRGVNAAVAECAGVGLLRSATLMPNGTAFEDAVAVAGGLRDFGVGIHFVLTKLRPVSDPAAVPHLAGRDGLLPSGPAELLKIIATRGGAARDIKRELLAQAQKVLDSGIRPTHFDSHKHVHIIPVVFEVMIEVANRFRVKWMRDPFERPDALRFLFDVKESKRKIFLKQYAGGLAACPVRPYFGRRLHRAGIDRPDFFHGVSATGILTEELMVRLAAVLKPGINELMTHPGYLDEDLIGQGTRLLHSRESEREILSSDYVKRLFTENGIMLSHFGEVNR